MDVIVNLIVTAQALALVLVSSIPPVSKWPSMIVPLVFLGWCSTMLLSWLGILNDGDLYLMAALVSSVTGFAAFQRCKYMAAIVGDASRRGVAMLEYSDKDCNND